MRQALILEIGIAITVLAQFFLNAGQLQQVGPSNLERLMIRAEKAQDNLVEDAAEIRFNASAAPSNISTIFVISMQGTPGVHSSNQGRLDDFKRKWEDACGTMVPIPKIVHCHGVFDPRRGYGITISQLICMQKAKKAEQDISLFFEDDARLYNESAAAFCNEESRSSEILSNMPNDTLIALLGGHTWEYAEDSSFGNDDEYAISQTKPRTYQYRDTVKSFGAYGFAVPRRNLDLLVRTLEDDLIYGFRDENNGRRGNVIHDNLSPETSFYRTARLTGLKIYAIDPLLVWHQGGFSNTWHKERGTINSTVFTVKDYSHMYWENLDTTALQAAKLLGFTEDTWDKDSYIPIYSTPIQELRPKDKKAVELLGIQDRFT